MRAHARRRAGRDGARFPALLVLVVLLALLDAPSAQARSADRCAGRSYGTVVRAYQRGSERLPLRCGTGSWGLRHLRGRWSTGFDARIALTLARGEAVVDYQQDGGSVIYALFDTRCRELFRVVYNSQRYLGRLVQPQGIITAYGPARLRSAGAARGDAMRYRTDCAIIQEI